TDELKNYDYILDLHSSSNNCPLFGIITQPNEEKINFAKNLGLKKIVLMPDSFASGKSLIDFCKCGISLEVGPHGRKENSDEVIGLIDNFLGENIYREDMIVFEIFKIIKQKYKNIKIKNFEKVEKNQMLTQDETGVQFAEEEFVPVLVGEKAYHGILCLAARKVNLKDMGSLLNHEKSE
ncbi:MAG: succinylglutamate desuccinylase/aspartoacylase family protein, partial [Nanoarchaeota archaeon]|nr:succinylglutamate desuccinylase/aspartoacylase family protein [Nanoarchaeota archaeon]